MLAVNDTTSGAGVILETTRIRGILKGDASGQLEVVGIVADQRIQPGENVLTAGGDLIFPRGLPVGVVEKVVPDPERDGFIDMIVKPAAHLDRLDEVLVITSTQPRFSPQEQQDMATSESRKERRADRDQGPDEGVGDHGREAAGPDRSQPAARPAAAARQQQPESRPRAAAAAASR